MAKHQWLIMATYEFSEEELTKVDGTANAVGLDRAHLVSVEGPGCFKCEHVWHEAKGMPCVVPDVARLEHDTSQLMEGTGREH